MKKYFYTTVILLTISCNSGKKPEPQQQPAGESNIVTLTNAQLKNSKIKTGMLQYKSVSSTLKVTGKIEVPPQNMVSISIPLGGYLKTTKLLPGMHVRKGESIAVIEDPQYISLQQDYLIEKAKLNYSETEFRRQEELNKTKAVSDKAFQQAKVDYVSQKVTIKSLSEKLRLIGINPDILNESNLSRSINIYSPIDGFVSKVNVNIGKYANPSDILFELVNPSDIHLALTVYEKDIHKLHIGQKLQAFTNNDETKKFPCEILLIGKDISRERSVEVHCHFEKYDNTLIPGMFMNAEIDIQSNHALVVPSDAIVIWEGKQYVFISENAGRFKMIGVNSINKENNFTQIELTEDVNIEKTPFVTEGAYTLLMKLKNTEED